MNEPSDSAAPVQDGRRPPFCYQTHDALGVVRANFTGAKLTTALAIYLSMTETANRHGGAEARNGFPATRAEIADAAGLSVDTLDRYVADLVKIGLVGVERRRVDGVNLPNVWVLLDPVPVPPVAAPVRPGGSRTRAAQGAKKTTKAEEEPTAPAPTAPAAGVVTLDLVPRTVDRKTVSAAEGDLAIRVLVEWNSQTGQALTAKDWLAKIVMRIREHPELGIGEHAHVIAANLARPWWKGHASPSVIYGNGAIFERTKLEAERGPAPGAGLTPDEMRRFVP